MLPAQNYDAKQKITRLTKGMLVKAQISGEKDVELMPGTQIPNTTTAAQK